MFDRLGKDGKKDFQYLHGILITTSLLALPTVSMELSWLQFIVPLPVFYYLSIFGFRKGGNLIAGAIALAGMIAALKGSLAALLFSATMLPTGVVLAACLERQVTPLKTAIYACLALATGWLGWAVIFGIIHQVSPVQSLIDSLNLGLETTAQALRNSSDLSPERLAEVEAALKELKAAAPRILPGILMTTIISTVAFNLIFGQWLIRRKDALLVGWEFFSAWRLPEPLIFGVILTGFMLLLPVDMFHTAGLNLLFLFGVLYFFQGLAIVSKLLDKWSVPMPLRILIYLLVVIQAYGIIMLTVTGIADVWADFRKFKVDSDKE